MVLKMKSALGRMMNGNNIKGTLLFYISFLRINRTQEAFPFYVPGLYHVDLLH